MPEKNYEAYKLRVGNLQLGEEISVILDELLESGWVIKENPCENKKIINKLITHNIFEKLS